MKPRLLLIDNYDSFTYNLVQAFLVLGAEVDVRRNDEISVEQALQLDHTHLCISPGLGTPYDAGVSMDMIRAFAVVAYLAGLAMKYFRRPHDLAAIRRAHGLVPQADAQDREPSPQPLDQLHGNACLLGRAGPGRNDDAFGFAP